MKKFISLLTACFLTLSPFAFGASTATCNDTDTKLSLPFDGHSETDAGTTTTDDSASAHSVTYGGNAQNDNAQSKFGGMAVVMDGTGDLLTIGNTQTDWNHGTGNMTLEAEVRFNALPSASTYMYFYSHYTSGSFATNGAWYFAIFNSAGTYQLEFGTYSGAFHSVNKNWSTPSTGVWYHVVMIRTGSTVRFFVDGTQVGTDGTDGDDLTLSSVDLYVGADSAGLFSMNGWFDQPRVVNGTAVWTSNFTAPSAAYSTTCSSAHNFALMGVGQ